MIEPKAIGLIGGVAGSLIVLGGVGGTWASLRSAKTRAERRFIARASAALWLAAAAFLGLLALRIVGLVPEVVYWIGFGVFMGSLGPVFRYVDRRQAVLSRAEVVGAAARRGEAGQN